MRLAGGRRCNDRAVAAALPRKVFAHLADLLSGVADSFPLPMPSAGWHMSGITACMAVHAFLQVRLLVRLGRGRNDWVAGDYTTPYTLP